MQSMGSQRVEHNLAIELQKQQGCSIESKVERSVQCDLRQNEAEELGNS